MHYTKVKGLLSAKNGMNLYRGCSHGCIYCDARSKCYHMEHAFEDIEVKENALELLERELAAKRKKCMIGTGAMSDPYIPAENELTYMRRVLELVSRYGFGVTLQTKSDLVLRDLDLLQSVNEQTKSVVQMTLTTYDDSLCKILEPNVCTTEKRFEALMRFKSAGIPTVVWLSPLLPYINDTEENVSAILDLCAEAGVYGVINFGMGLTLREGNREYFYKQLDRLFPGLKERYMREYGYAYEVPSPDNVKLMRLFHEKCERYGLVHDNGRIFAYLSRFESKTEQLSFWSFPS